MSGPNIWGPHGWKFLHYVTMGYPDEPTQEDKNTYKQFFELFAQTIPCDLCANNYKHHLQLYPLSDYHLENRMRLIQWGISMHNLVNEMHEKKTFTFEEGLEEISKFDHHCKEIKFNSSYIIFAIFLGIIIGMYLKTIKK
jgi:hypothetical protein